MTITEDSYYEQHNIEQTQMFRLNFQVNKEMLNCDVAFQKKKFPFSLSPMKQTGQAETEGVLQESIKMSQTIFLHF